MVFNKNRHIARTVERIPQGYRSFYFEARVTDCGRNGSGCIGIGIMQPTPWYKPQSFISYYGDSGNIFHNTDYNRHFDSGDAFTKGDVVGCLINREIITDFESHYISEFITVQFTKNGKTLSHPIRIKDDGWYPALYMDSDGACVDVNFRTYQFIETEKGMTMFRYVIITITEN